MAESIPASLIIDTLKDTFREARAARTAEGWGQPASEHLGWILSVPDTHQKTVLAALDKEESIRVLTCATEDEAATIAAGLGSPGLDPQRAGHAPEDRAGRARQGAGAPRGHLRHRGRGDRHRGGTLRGRR